MNRAAAVSAPFVAWHPILFTGDMVRAILAGLKTQTRRCIRVRADKVRLANCPYGFAGDRLWVRETWDVEQGSDDPEDCVYRADLTPALAVEHKWHPSIYMPRWASRIALEVTAVRVERVQQITDEDAMAEGIQFRRAGGVRELASPRDEFAELWNAINGKRPGCAWSANPVVWVVNFQRAS